MAHLSLLTCSVHHQIFSPKYFNHLSVSHVPLHSVPTAESQTASALTWTPALAIPFQFLCTFLQLKWSFTWRYCMTQLFTPNWPPAGVRIKTSSTTACCSGQPWPSRGLLLSLLLLPPPLLHPLLNYYLWALPSYFYSRFFQSLKDELSEDFPIHEYSLLYISLLFTLIAIGQRRANFFCKETVNILGFVCLQSLLYLLNSVIIAQKQPLKHKRVWLCLWILILGLYIHSDVMNYSSFDF